MTEFETFKREFKKYQSLFGLNGYDVYFKYEPLEDCFSDITTGNKEMVATVRLSNIKHPDRDAKICGKHEAIHLLIARLEYLTYSRFINEDEVYQSCEELVRKLENIIK